MSNFSPGQPVFVRYDGRGDESYTGPAMFVRDILPDDRHYAYLLEEEPHAVVYITDDCCFPTSAIQPGTEPVPEFEKWWKGLDFKPNGPMTPILVESYKEIAFKAWCAGTLNQLERLTFPEPPSSASDMRDHCSLEAWSNGDLRDDDD